MLAAGLFKDFPRPDYGLALHCDDKTAYGTVSYSEDLALANVDAVDILVHGKGGHGAAPHTTIDPVVIAARIVLDLQTLVSRETNPLDPAVVTVGSIHGGSKHNIIPSEVKLQLTVRSTKDSVRKHLLDGIRRIARAAAEAAGAPEPDVHVELSEFTPALVNDGNLARKTASLFKDVLGEDKVRERPPIMGGEDFSRYGRAGVPIFLYFLGTLAPERVAEAGRAGAKPLPSLHSDLFPRARADHQDRRADHEHGGAEPAREIACLYTGRPSRSASCLSRSSRNARTAASSGCSLLSEPVSSFSTRCRNVCSSVPSR
jgi:hippurate hydrolase